MAGRSTTRASRAAAHSRRELDLEYTVDGVPVPPSNSSFWAFDNKIQYVPPYSPSYNQLDALFLINHDGFRMFALMMLPVFYLNSVGRSGRTAGLVGTIVGYSTMLLLIWYQGTVLRHARRTTWPKEFDIYDGQFQVLPMLAFGKNDIVSIMPIDTNSRFIAGMALFANEYVVTLPVYLFLIFLSFRWLAMKCMKPIAPKKFARLTDKLDSKVEAKRAKKREKRLEKNVLNRGRLVGAAVTTGAASPGAEEEEEEEAAASSKSAEVGVAVGGNPWKISGIFPKRPCALCKLNVDDCEWCKAVSTVVGPMAAVRPPFTAGQVCVPVAESAKPKPQPQDAEVTLAERVEHYEVARPRATYVDKATSLVRLQTKLEAFAQETVFNGVGPGRSRVEAFEGQPEEPSLHWLLETSYEERHRCARNHVRMLLRGKVWYEAQLVKLKNKKKDKKAKTEEKERKKREKTEKREKKEAAKKAKEGGEGGEGGEKEAKTPSKVKALLAKLRWPRRRTSDDVHPEAPAVADAKQVDMEAHPPTPPPSPPDDAAAAAAAKREDGTGDEGDEGDEGEEGEEPEPSPEEVLAARREAARKAEEEEERQKKLDAGLTEEERRVKHAKNRRAPLEQIFFYPQRVKLAFGLSVWISFLLTCVVCNGIHWLANIYTSAAFYCDVMKDQAAQSDQLKAATFLSINPVLLFAAICRTPLADEEYRPVIVSWLTFLFAVTIPVMMGTVLCQWFFIFMSVKSDTFAMRSGSYFINKAKYPEVFAGKYIGFQVSHMTVSFLIVCLLYMIIMLLLSPLVLVSVNQDVRDAAEGTILVQIQNAFGYLAGLNTVGIVTPLILTILFQNVVNKRVFFVGDYVNSWLRFRWLYALYDYNLIYTNALLGLAVVISRIATLLVFFILFLARLDKSTMPGPRGNFLNFDPAFKSYIAVLRMDHRYNNPIFMVFGEIMLRRLTVRRAVCHVRSIRLHAIDADPNVRRRRLSRWALSIVWEAFDHNEARCLLVRNRWQMIWRLMQQPDLRAHREQQRVKRAIIRTNLLAETLAAAPAAAPAGAPAAAPQPVSSH